MEFQFCLKLRSLNTSMNPFFIPSQWKRVEQTGLSILNQRLIWFLESNNLLSNLQTGFRAKRSTINQIVRIGTLIRESFIKKEHLVAVLFDLEKPMIQPGHMAYSKTSDYKADSPSL